MSKRIHFQTAVPAQPPRDWRRERPPRDELAQKMRGAVFSGAALTIILLLFIIPIPAIQGASFEVLAWIVVACLGLGILYGAYLALRWVKETVERPWTVQDNETSRKNFLEDLDRARADLLASVTRQESRIIGGTSAANIPVVALEILRRHFLGQETTRRSCTRDGVCTTSEWNMVSGLLKRLGLKSGYSLQPGDTLLEAWDIWHTNVKVEDDQLWLRGESGGWSLVD